MKKCPKCKKENPSHANFCRSCGKQFSDATMQEQQTSDFPSSQMSNNLNLLRPANSNDFVYFDKNGHDNMFLAVSFAIFIIPIMVFFVTGGEGMYIAGFLEILPITYIIIKIIPYMILRNKFKDNVDFIEDGGPIVRVAKRNLMGLYERTNRVLLESIYSRIIPFDENHFLLEQDGKKGLYSKTYKKIIVPVQYDSISSFNNYTTIATSNGISDQYDVKGNKWS